MKARFESSEEQAFSDHLSYQLKKDSAWVCTQSLQSCLTLCDPVGYIATQAPLSMGFSSKNTGVGCRFLFQGIFPTQGTCVSYTSCIGRWVLYH